MAIFLAVSGNLMTADAFLPPTPASHPSSVHMANIYDDWRSDAVVDTMPLDEENVRMCLEEFVESDYGKQMFGCHDLPAS